MKHLLIALLVFACVAQADVDSLKGTTVTADAGLRVDNPTLNYGSTTSLQMGWSNAGVNYGNVWVAFNCSTLVASIAAAGEETDSVVLRIYNDLDITGQNRPRVFAMRATPSAREGTQNGVYENSNCSANNRGFGTAFDNSTIAQADSAWSRVGGARVFTGTEPYVDIPSAVGHSSLNVTDQVTDSTSAGRNYVAFLLEDTVWTHSGSQHDRCRIVLSEGATAVQQPTLFWYHSLHVAPDPDFMRVAVTCPGGAQTDLPVLVSWLTYPANASYNFTVYASDSTSKLYWCMDSIAGHYTRIWVGGSNADWGASDSLFISTDINPSYQNCDSVFLEYIPFNNIFQATQLCDTLTEGDRVARDTLNGGTPIIDCLAEGLTWMFENSNIVETDSGYYMVLCGGFTSPYEGATDPQDSTFGFSYRSSDLKNWTNEGMIVCTRSASGGIPAEDTIRIQDAYLMQDGDTLRMVFEDKRIYNTKGSYDMIGMMVSVNHGVTWSYRGVLVDSLLWDSDNECSPSSPVLWKIGSLYWLAGECKNGSYDDDSGTPRSTEGGAVYLARGTSLYNLEFVESIQTELAFEPPAIPYTAAYNYACVPDAHWVEGTTHFVSAHTQQDSGDSWQVSVWSIAESALNGTDAVTWGDVTEISRKARFWDDSSLTNRALADDPQPFVVDGNYYMLTSHRTGANPDSVTDIYFAPVVEWDTTGNPYPVTFRNKEYLGAVGYVHSENGTLKLVPEPYSERSSVGFVTVDSFQTNFAVDIRYRFPYPDHRVYTSFSMGNGNPVAYTDSVGSAPYNYEVTNLQDGWYFLYNYGTEQVVPGTQPVLDNRTTGTAYSAPTYSNSAWNTHSFAVVGNGTNDTVRSGFQYSLTNAARYDSADTDYKRIAVFAGTYLYDLTNGGVEIDKLQVRKYVSGGFTTQASDTLYAVAEASVDSWGTWGDAWRRANQTQWRSAWK